MMLFAEQSLPFFFFFSWLIFWTWLTIPSWDTRRLRSSPFSTHTSLLVPSTTGDASLKRIAVKQLSASRRVSIDDVRLCWFRPLYLPLRMLFTAESFSLSSNIIVDTATFHLRYSFACVTDVPNILQQDHPCASYVS